MTDQELKDLVASLAVAQAKSEADNAAGFAALRETQAKTEKLWAKHQLQYAQTDAQLEKTDRKFKTMQDMLDGISKNQGSVAEEFFFNSLNAKPVIGDIKFDRVTPHLIVGRKGKQSEYDVVMVNGASVGIVEIKYKAHLNDLQQVHEQVKRFKRDCPEFKGYAIYGGIAGLSVPNDVSKAAKEQGLFVLKRKGEHLEAQTEGMRGF
jgi:hypothetical protein